MKERLMATMRPMDQIEDEFDPETVEALKAIDAQLDDEGDSTPASDATDMKNARGEGVNLDATD
jgi:hypothetical protein